MLLNGESTLHCCPSSVAQSGVMSEKTKKLLCDFSTQIPIFHSTLYFISRNETLTGSLLNLTWFKAVAFCTFPS